MNILNVENSIKLLEQETSALNGKLDILIEQNQEAKDRLSQLKELQDTNKKAVELLNFVQKATKENICNVFESVVSKALQYVHQSNDYKFQLEFGQRGNLPELKFNVKTPDLQESHDIIDSRGGGSCDIISLALRLVLLEVSKYPGFIFLDEPEKHLDSPETLEKMIEFVKEFQKSSKRQIFWITHKEEVVNSVENAIVLKNSNNTQKSISNETEDKPKKRGRPKNVK